MTTMRSTPRRSHRLVGVAVAAALGTGVVAGCNGEQAGPTPPVPPGGLTPLGAGPSTVPIAAGERRPERTSSLVAVGTCERLGEVIRPRVLEALTAAGSAGDMASSSGDARTTGAARESAAPTVPTAAAPAAPQAGVDFSGTNVQEAGIDEPDRVKTDGRLLVTNVDGRLRVVDVNGPPRLVGTLDLPGQASSTSDGGGDLLLVGDRALVLGHSFDRLATGSGSGSSSRPRTTITVVDLKDPARPVVARTHSIDGSYLDARLVGGVVRIVTRSQPDLPFRATGRNGDGASATNAEVVAKTSPTAFLPQGASCADAYVPVESSGTGTVAVQSLDPSASAPGPAVTVVADASTVYATAGRLFVATNSSSQVRPASRGIPSMGRIAPALVEPARTAIHAFDITDPAKARYVGSGDVPGRLLNQFSLSEHEGALRVATTSDAGFASVDGDRPSQSQSQSRVTVLRPAGEQWVETGAVDGLGKGERIYAVRFLGATGYVVTFRQVDPLYVLDLRDPRSPRLTGELKITGYSAYLHPAGDGRLLGIGQEATDQGRRLGTQLSLFDVGDPKAPAKLAGAVLPQASSSAEDDHHAFLFWPATGLVVAPVQSYGGGRVVDRPEAAVKAPEQGFVGAVAFAVGDRAVAETARITHPSSTPIDRSLVVGGRLLTVSRVGVATNDLATLADAGFLTFR